MGWRTSDGKTSLRLTVVKNNCYSYLLKLSYVNRGPIKAPYWRIYIILKYFINSLYFYGKL